MDRRKFITVLGGGLVATATMEHAGMWAEFMDWMKRKPVFSIPSPLAPELELTLSTASFYDKMFLSNLKRNMIFSSSLNAIRLPMNSGSVITFPYQEALCP